MNTYEKIKNLLELGTLKGVAVQDGNKWRVLVYLVPGGIIYGTSLRDSIETSLLTGLADCKYTQEEYKEFTNITPIPQKPKVLEVGTKVRILDIAREVEDYGFRSDATRYMVGKDYDIEEVMDNFNGVYYRIAEYTFPSYCVVPSDCLEEEETIEVNGKVYLKSDYDEAIKNLKEIKK